ncbi:MAG: Gfo/Idh/MocA family oxidoreductase [Cyclobacteriaceae bacterium]|nr:Gfo/Idh/MocA family oxidoreductase [Cyclobacteriaceae bacterium]
MKRRSFIKKTMGASLVAASAPMIVAPHVLGLNGKISPSNKINMSFVGVGGMGSGHVQRFLEYADVNVGHICDVREEHRLNAKQVVDKKYGNRDCKVYGDFREMLARPEIDAVLIAVPDHWHALIGIEAARQHKDMYYEKPLTRYFNEAKAVRDAVNNYGVVFQLGTQQRSDSRYRQAVEIVRNQLIGKLERVIVGSAGYSQVPNQPAQPVPAGFDYDMWLGPAPVAPFTKVRCTRHFTLIYDYSLGCISGAYGIHDIDIVQWALDADNSGPIEIEGKGRIAEDGLFDTIGEWETIHTYENGVKLIYTDHISARKNHPEYKLQSMGIVFIGSEGWVSVSRQAIEASSKSILTSVIGPDQIRMPVSNDHSRNFLDCVKSRQKTMCPVEVASRSDAVCHQADIAIRLGRKVQWDPVDEQFVNDDAANRMLTGTMRSPWHL